MLQVSKIIELIKRSEIRFENDFAIKLGISANGWQAIKKKGTTSRSRACKIAEILGVEVKEILTEEYYNVYKDELRSELTRDFSERLKQLIHYTGLSLREFAKKTEIPYSTIGTALARNSVNLQFLYQVSITFKWLNVRWIITGEETMFSSESSGTKDTRIEIIEKQLKKQLFDLEQIQSDVENLKKKG